MDQWRWTSGGDQEEEGVWGWSDGSPWNYTRWGSGSGVRGKEANCLTGDINKLLRYELLDNGYARAHKCRE